MFVAAYDDKCSQSLSPYSLSQETASGLDGPRGFDMPERPWRCFRLLDANMLCVLYKPKSLLWVGSEELDRALSMFIDVEALSALSRLG